MSKPCLYCDVLDLDIYSKLPSKKVKCIKWEGDLNTSPDYICKDCGYPINCHGPYKGESWRHIFVSKPFK